MEENTIIHKLLEIIEYKNEYQHQSSNIPPQDMYVLERIYFSGKMVVRDISKQYNIPPSTLTGIIDRLERKEFIQRLRTNADRRAVELVTTEKGNTVVEQHIREDIVFSSNFFNALDPDKKEKFKKLLWELLSNINKDSLFTANKE